MPARCCAWNCTSRSTTSHMVYSNFADFFIPFVSWIYNMWTQL